MAKRIKTGPADVMPTINLDHRVIFFAPVDVNSLAQAALVTFTADASTDTLTAGSSHGLILDDLIFFTTTGTLPGGIVAGTFYRVVGTVTATTFQIIDNASFSEPGGWVGAPLDITSAGTGTHYLWARPFEAFDTFTAVNATDLLTTTLPHHLLGDSLEQSRVRFTNVGGALPAPLAANTDYWVIASGLGSKTLKVSAARAGTVVNLTTDGTGTHTIWTKHKPNGRVKCAGDLGIHSDEYVLFPSDQFDQRPVWGLFAMPPAYRGLWYDEQFYMENVTEPVNYSVFDSALPGGLALGNIGVGKTGRVVGTPTATGTFNFTLRATNAEGSADKDFTIVVNPSPATDFWGILAG